MKKITLFAVVLFVAGAMTSCLRSDDLDLLRHPIHITGSANPQYGIPVATGELDINDLLSSFSADYAGMITDDDVITVQYQMNLSDTIKALSNISLKNSAPKVKGGAPSPKATWMSKDTTMVDTIDIDFFNDVDYAGLINIEHIWLTLKVGAFGRGAEMVRPYIRARFFNLHISYEDHNGVVKDFGGMPAANVQINDIYEGFNHHFDSVDIQSIVNDMPRRIFTSYTFRFSVSSDLVMSNIMSMPYAEILDSVQMTELIYSADLNVSMPLSVQFNGLNYSYDVSLGDGLNSLNLDSIMSTISEDINFDVDSARFRLKMFNGIPLNLRLSATMQDANGNDLIYLFNNESVAAANLASNPANPTQFVAISEKESELNARLDNADMDKIHLAKNLKVDLTIDSDNKHVLIRRSDKLRLKGFLVVKPTVGVDIPVTDNGIF